jgi:ribonuclease P protein component
LAAALRLRRSGEFAATVRGGRRCGRGAVVVHLMFEEVATGPARPARAGFVVPKAVGVAVVRNRVKRRLRHLVRERVGDLPVGSDLVVRALPDAATRSYSQLGADLDSALAVARARGPVRR